MVLLTTDQLTQINPYRLWQVVSYDNISGSDVHYVICCECEAYFHYGNKYDIVVSSLDVDSVANVTELDKIEP